MSLEFAKTNFVKLGALLILGALFFAEGFKSIFEVLSTILMATHCQAKIIVLLGQRSVKPYLIAMWTCPFVRFAFSYISFTLSSAHQMHQDSLLHILSVQASLPKFNKILFCCKFVSRRSLILVCLQMDSF